LPGCIWIVTLLLLAGSVGVILSSLYEVFALGDGQPSLTSCDMLAALDLMDDWG